MQITAAARQSPLSKAQFKEIERELYTHHPFIHLQPYFVTTQGDKDLKTSLRDFHEKTDFFTKEIDELILQKKCRIGIHSAKDLPEPLPKGLMITAITIGVDSRDALVFRQGESLTTLPLGAKIATSSARRDQAVRGLRQDLTMVDVRGTIEERLAKLDRHEADGVVVAEAALIRLKLTYLNRLWLPGASTPLQGKLAVVCRGEDVAMKEMFKCLDRR